ncbi:MAG: hypothetical protein K0S68_1160 [Candidatus Saccharibacteria bacterium]|nr:hypothetical protein [Candidatus Saccharibacteria bacterium]
MFILSAFCLCLSDSMTSCLVVGLVLTLVRFSRRDVAIAKKGHDPRKRVLRTPLSISGLSSAWPATEIQEEWASPLGSEGRGSRQALTTVASPLMPRVREVAAREGVASADVWAKVRSGELVAYRAPRGRDQWEWRLGQRALPNAIPSISALLPLPSERTA